MALTYLDHVNIRTANLAAMSRFYEAVLGLPAGWRPGFRFGGAWLYCGDKASVHLVEVPRQPATGEPRVEHFAFRADDLAGFLNRLRDHGVAYTIAVVPNNGNKQVNIFDPDGNHIEIQFAAQEEADLAPFLGRADQAASNP